MTAPAEFCPLNLPSGDHAWTVAPLLLEGVRREECARCTASRITLAGGLGPFLEALQGLIVMRAGVAYGDGIRWAARNPTLAGDAESWAHWPTGTNQEHAQLAPPDRNRVDRLPPLGRPWPGLMRINFPEDENKGE